MPELYWSKINSAKKLPLIGIEPSTPQTVVLTSSDT